MKRFKKFGKRCLAVALIAMSIVGLAVPAMAAKVSVSGTATIKSANGSPVNVRSGPGTSYKLASVGTYKVGTSVRLLYRDTNGSETWYEVTTSSTASSSGFWVRSDFLNINNGGPNPTTPPSGGSVKGTNVNVGEWIQVNKSDVNIRKDYPNGDILFRRSSPAKGEVLEKGIAKSDGVEYYWYKFKPDTTTGWIRGDMVIKTTPGSTGGNTGGSTKTYKTGNYVAIDVNSAGAKVRPSAGTTGEPIGLLFNGAKLICVGTEAGSNGKLYVKVRWGGKTYSTGYIDSDFANDSGSAPSNNLNAAIAIGQSLASGSYTKANLGLDGNQWCVQYMTFLRKAAGCATYPAFSPSLVSDAINFTGGYKKSTPAIGDFAVYSSNKGGTYAHVGLVTSTSGSTPSTVEGDAGGSTYSGSTPLTDRNYWLEGYYTPSW